MYACDKSEATTYSPAVHPSC